MCEMYLTEHDVAFPGQYDNCSEGGVDGVGTT